VRVVFLATPEFAVPTLEAVAREHDIVLVVAQPDRPAGRGMRIHRPPVAERADQLGLRVMQPVRVRDDALLDEIATLAPDAGVVIAYGKILPKRLLEIPRHGFINVHGSVLPKYRGAAPIQRAIEAGETTTGVTIMRVDEELDHGPILRIETLDIGPDERLPSLSQRMAELGAAALTRTLAGIERGTVTETPQDHSRATYAPKIEKSEGLITFTEPAHVIYNRFRAFDPWPGVFFGSGGETIKIAEMRPDIRVAPARVVAEIDDSVVIGVGDSTIRTTALQRPGKTPAAAADVARGLGWRVGEPLP
jgi:methionyl-tRNA formyltransferase